MSAHYFAFQFYPDHEGDLALKQALNSVHVAHEEVVMVMKDGFTNTFDPSDNISMEFRDAPSEKRWDLAWEISRRILFEHYEKLFMLTGKVGLGEYKKFLKYRQACAENLTFFSPLAPYFCYEGYPLFAIGDPKKATAIMFVRT